MRDLLLLMTSFGPGFRPHPRTREAMALMTQTRQAMETLNRAFEKQLEKLMQNELFDMEADIRLLKQTMKMEGYEEEN